MLDAGDRAEINRLIQAAVSQSADIRTLPVPTGWSNFQPGVWSPGRMVKFADGLVVISGLITPNASVSVNGSSIIKLPSGWEPRVSEIRKCSTSLAQQWDAWIQRDGQIIVQATTGIPVAGTDWFSLGGITYYSTS